MTSETTHSSASLQLESPTPVAPGPLPLQSLSFTQLRHKILQWSDNDSSTPLTILGVSYDLLDQIEDWITDFYSDKPCTDKTYRPKMLYVASRKELMIRMTPLWYRSIDIRLMCILEGKLEVLGQEIGGNALGREWGLSIPSNGYLRKLNCELPIY